MSEAEREWYFAYGANMASQVLVRRDLEPLESQAACLLDFRLTFEESGMPWIEPCFASLRQAPGEEVHGVLHRFTAPQLERLDQLESDGYDRIYTKVVGRAAGVVEASFYMSRDYKSGRRPSRRYLNLLIAGAREHRLPETWISRLEQQPSFHLPIVHRAMPLLLAWAEGLRHKSRRFHELIRRFSQRL